MRRLDLEQWGGKDVARLLALVETERRYYQKIVAGVPIGILVLSGDLRVLAANRAFRDKFLVQESLKEIFGRALDFVLPVPEIREAALEVIRTGRPVRNRYAELSTPIERLRLRVGITKLHSSEEDGPSAEEELLLMLEEASPAELSIETGGSRIRAIEDATVGGAQQRARELRRVEREMERRLRAIELEKEQLLASWKDRERVLLTTQEDLEIQLQHAEEQRAALSAEKDAREDELATLEEERKRLADLEARLEERVDALEDRRLALREEYTKKELDFREAEKQRDELAAAREDLAKRLDAVLSERQEMAARLSELEQRLRTAEDERGKLRSAEAELELRLLHAEQDREKLSALQADQASSTEQISRIQEDLQASQGRLQELSAEREQLSGRVIALEGDLNAAREQLATALERESSLTAELAKVEKAKAELESVHISSEQRFYEASREVSRLEELEHELADARQELERDRRELARLQEVNQTREAEAVQARQELEGRLAAQAQELAAASERNQSLEQTLIDFHRALHDLEQANGVLRTEREELLGRLETAGLSGEGLADERNRAFGRIAALEQETERLRADAARLEAALAAAQEREKLAAEGRAAEVQSLAQQNEQAALESQQSVAALESRLNEVRTANQAAEAALAEARQQVETLEQQVTAADATLHEREQAVAQALSTIQELEARLNESAATASESTSALAAARDRIAAVEQELASAQAAAEAREQAIAQNARETMDDLQTRLTQAEAAGQRLKEAEEAVARLQLTVKALERLRSAEQESARKTSELVDQIGAAIWESEAGTYRITFANRVVRRWLGLAPDQLPSAPHVWLDAVHAEDREKVLAVYEMASGLGEARTHQFRLVPAGGTPIWIRETISPGSSEGGPRKLRGVSMEIPEPRQQETVAPAASATTAGSGEVLGALGEFAERIADTLGNLLTSVSGYSEFILERMGGTARYSPFLRDIEEIKKAGDRAASLNRQLRAFAGLQYLQKRRADVNAVLGEMQNLLQRMLGDEIRLALDLSPDAPDVDADHGQLEQMILNLAVNAREAMPSGGELYISTASGAMGAGKGEGARQGLVLTVRDTGVGMDQETLAHAFQPFFTTRGEAGALGLGLATVYGFVKQSDGDVRIDSKPGSGTTIRIWLPRTKGEVETPEPRRFVQSLFGTETILVVEEDESLQALLRNVLQRKGYTVVDSLAPEEGLRIAREHAGPIHLLLADCTQAVSGGTTLIEAIRGIREDVRTLHIPAQLKSDPSRPMQDMRLDAILLKPFTLDTLLRRVRETLGPNLRASSGAGA